MKIVSRKNRQEYVMGLARELNMIREDSNGNIDYSGLVGYAYRSVGGNMREFGDDEFRRLTKFLEQDVERRRREDEKRR